MKYTYKLFENGKEKNVKPIIFTAIIAFVAIVLIIVAVHSVKSGNDETTTTASVATTEKITDAQNKVTQEANATSETQTKDVVTPDGDSLGTTVIPSTAGTTNQLAQSSAATTKAPAPTTAQDPLSYSDEQVLKVVGDSVNKLKASQNFLVDKKLNVVIKLTDCSLPALTGTINKVLESFAKDKNSTYDFTNGITLDPDDGTEMTAMHAVPPTDVPFTLTKDGVASTKVEKDGDNVTYTVMVIGEKTTLETPEPKFNAMSSDYLNLADIDLTVGEITKCDFDYPGNSVSVTLDSYGNIVGYRQYIPMSGTGEGKVGFLSASGTIEGYMDEVWKITWK